jgi:hypothetical protein
MSTWQSHEGRSPSRMKPRRRTGSSARTEPFGISGQEAIPGAWLSHVARHEGLGPTEGGLLPASPMVCPESGAGFECDPLSHAASARHVELLDQGGNRRRGGRAVNRSGFSAPSDWPQRSDSTSSTARFSLHSQFITPRNSHGVRRLVNLHAGLPHERRVRIPRRVGRVTIRAAVRFSKRDPRNPPCVCPLRIPAIAKSKIAGAMQSTTNEAAIMKSCTMYVPPPSIGWV